MIANMIIDVANTVILFKRILLKYKIDLYMSHIFFISSLYLWCRFCLCNFKL